MFLIEFASENDIKNIMSIIKTATELLPDPSWFVDDTEEFFLSHIKEKGFTLKAISDGNIAAFLTIRYPGLDEDNLGYSLDFSKEDLLSCAHIESCAVLPQYRGNRLEYQLIKEALSILENTSYTHILGTVHPDNLASVKSFLNNGFHIEKTVPKYGGLPRHILYKKLKK